MNQSSSGFSLIEVLIAIVVLGIALVPAMDAMRTGMKSVDFHQKSQLQHYQLMTKMEAVLTESFSDLSSVALAASSPSEASSYSDAEHNVYLFPYDVDDSDGDGDVFTDNDFDVIWVRTERVDSGLSFETLTGP